jgi:hypothetical protein
MSLDHVEMDDVDQVFSTPRTAPSDDALARIRAMFVLDCQLMEGHRGVQRQLLALEVGHYSVFPLTRRNEIDQVIDGKWEHPVTRRVMRFSIRRCGGGLRVTREA